MLMLVDDMIRYVMNGQTVTVKVKAKTVRRGGRVKALFTVRTVNMSYYLIITTAIEYIVITIIVIVIRYCCTCMYLYSSTTTVEYFLYYSS